MDNPKSNDSILKFASGTIILKKVKFPKINKGSNIFDNSVSITGGSKNGSFYLSASNYEQTGIVPGTSFGKNTFRFNGEQKYGALTASANVSYSQSRTDKTFTSGGLYTAEGSDAMSALYG